MRFHDQEVDAAISALERFYRRVDEAVAKIVAQCGILLHCGPGCISCCMDDITVFSIEAENIRRKCGEILSGPPREPGACAFLGPNGLCRIYDARPKAGSTKAGSKLEL